MDNMPYLPKQNKVKDTERYRTEKLSPVLPEMQTGNPYQYTTNKCDGYQRARRTDAEPIAELITMIAALVFLHRNKENSNAGIWFRIQQ